MARHNKEFRTKTELMEENVSLKEHIREMRMALSQVMDLCAGAIIGKKKLLELTGHTDVMSSITQTALLKAGLDAKARRKKT